jgi:hypothetical protein
MQARTGVCGEADSGHDQALHDARANVLLQLAVLAGARGQQDLQHHPKARQAIGICQGDASAGHLMAFRPGLAIGGGARADAVQQGDEGVRVQRRAIRRRVADRVRGREWGWSWLGSLRACRSRHR